MNHKTYTANVEEDPETGELVLVFPEGLMAQVGWSAGDTIKWNDNKDGTWSLTKQEAKKDDPSDTAV